MYIPELDVEDGSQGLDGDRPAELDELVQVVGNILCSEAKIEIKTV